jgi:cell wall-associated NlpC family hydrolase
LIESGLALTRQNLTYLYGSADPANGGMDCSGFIYHVLKENGFTEVPRSASGQYAWLRKGEAFFAVLSRRSDTFELSELQPGDLLFWTGTYGVDRDPPVTHTMIYLGREKRTKQRVMVGASDGRSYAGLQRWGVSVFDFKVETNQGERSQARFVGFGKLPEPGKAADRKAAESEAAD